MKVRTQIKTIRNLTEYLVLACFAESCAAYHVATHAQITLQAYETSSLSQRRVGKAVSSRAHLRTPNQVGTLRFAHPTDLSMGGQTFKAAKKEAGAKSKSQTQLFE